VCLTSSRGSTLPLFDQIAIVKAVRAAGPNVVINGRAARGEGFNFGDYANTADRPAELRPTAGDWEAIPPNRSYLNTPHGRHENSVDDGNESTVRSSFSSVEIVF
jgi:hypothetical protein